MKPFLKPIGCEPPSCEKSWRKAILFTMSYPTARDGEDWKEIERNEEADGRNENMQNEKQYQASLLETVIINLYFLIHLT